MHLVLEVMAFSTASGDNVNVSSTSARTGMAPTLNTASKEATNVNVGIITSSPEPIPKAANAVVRAAVPLDTSCAYLHPNLEQISCSSSFDFHIPFLAFS